jgi:aryl-alcohol dehydrogenase
VQPIGCIAEAPECGPSLLGGSGTEALIPFLVDLVVSGRLPVEKLIRHYRFEDIQRAVGEVVSGETIKPVLRFRTG